MKYVGKNKVNHAFLAHWLIGSMTCAKFSKGAFGLVYLKSPFFSQDDFDKGEPKIKFIHPHNLYEFDEIPSQFKTSMYLSAL